MADRRRKNYIWNVADERGDIYSNMRDGCSLAVLMDIRDELQRLNSLLYCPNFTAIPRKLDRIGRNTTKKKTKARA